MLTIEEVRTRLGDRNLSELSRRTKISVPTLWRIAHICDMNHSYNAVKKLSDYFEQQESIAA